MTRASGTDGLLVQPIGVVRSPFRDKAQAPRQPSACRGVEASIELEPGRGFEFALSDLERWRYIWVLFWFHLARGWRARVRPPRSRMRRGVFSTRAPHRPNPIGMSAVELLEVDGLSLRVRNIDLVDGTPVLDIKPYVAYSDAIADAGAGWLTPEATEDPGPHWSVDFAPLAEEQANFLRERHGIDLRETVCSALELGPAPHPYRRIKREGDAFRLACGPWRVRFVVDGSRVTVNSLATGYRASELARPDLEAHRGFVDVFGYPGHDG
jgi:tRNA-Thr(GGU) m(6)t(6)A37 methyltransferase TsaA